MSVDADKDLLRADTLNRWVVAVDAAYELVKKIFLDVEDRAPLPSKKRRQEARKALNQLRFEPDYFVPLIKKIASGDFDRAEIEDLHAKLIEARAPMDAIIYAIQTKFRSEIEDSYGMQFWQSRIEKVLEMKSTIVKDISRICNRDLSKEELETLADRLKYEMAEINTTLAIICDVLVPPRRRQNL